MWKSFFKKGFSALFLLVLATPAFAELEQQLGIWGKISKTDVFSDTMPWGYELIAEDRQFNNHSADNLFNVGGFLTYQLTTKQQLALGYQFFHSYDVPTVGGRNENRLSQRWQLTIPTGKNSLSFQSTLQERQREDASPWNYRIRQKIEYRIPIKQWRLETYDEVFFNLNTPNWVVDQVFAENRAFLGTNYPLNTTTALKIGYLNRYLASNTNDRMQHILAIELNFS